MQQADGALEGIANDMFRARELAVQAANGALSDDQRKLVGEELSQILTSLLASANSRASDGSGLFAGEADGPAYTLDAGGQRDLHRHGATQARSTLGQGITVPRGVTGPQMFDFNAATGPTDMFALVGGLAEALKGTATDPAAAARAALGGFGDALESLTRAQTVIGVRAAWVETVQDRQIVAEETRAQETAGYGRRRFRQHRRAAAADVDRAGGEPGRLRPRQPPQPVQFHLTRKPDPCCQLPE